MLYKHVVDCESVWVVHIYIFFFLQSQILPPYRSIFFSLLSISFTVTAVLCTVQIFLLLILWTIWAVQKASVLSMNCFCEMCNLHLFLLEEDRGEIWNCKICTWVKFTGKHWATYLWNKVAKVVGLHLRSSSNNTSSNCSFYFSRTSVGFPLAHLLCMK